MTMTIQTSPSRKSSLKRSISLPEDGGGGNSFVTPNPNSYLKARRLPGKQQRRSKILSILDSSLDDVNYQFPDFSDSQEPFVQLQSPSHKQKAKSTKKRRDDNGASLMSSSASLTEEPDTRPMDEVLSTLYHDCSLTDSEHTSCTDMTSSASLGFITSSQNTSSCASLLGDEDFGITQELDFGEDQEESSSSGKNDKDRSKDKEVSQCKCVSCDEEWLEEEYIEEEYIEEVYSDSEETTEEEIVDDDGELSYDEIVVDEQGNDIVNGDDEFVEELDCADAQARIEEVIVEEDFFEEELVEEDDFIEEEVLDADYDEYIIGEEEYRESKFVASLGIIEEEDGDDENASACSQRSTKRLDSSLENSHSFSEYEENANLDDSLYEYEEEGDTYDEMYDEIYDDDDDETTSSYIEEEIIPRFEVPVVPAIALWQEQEKARVLDQEPPEVAPSTPRNILLAVLTTAAADFKLRKVPVDHKQRYVPLSQQAACLARLTKLNEHVTESTGRASGIQKDDEWQPTGAPIHILRSLNLRIATEAAAMGRVMRLKEKIFTNYKEPKREESNYNNNKTIQEVDDFVDDKGRKVFRTSVLVPIFHEQKVLHDSMSSRDWNLGFLEASTEADEKTVETVTLPTDRAPRFTKPSSSSSSPVTMSRQEIQDAIARGVAEGAWDRKYRLERPHIGLRITSHCPCRYCENPSAFQTHAYKRLSQQQGQRTQSM